MRLFKKKEERREYDPSCRKPVVRCSICTGEQVAGFRNLATGKIEEVMLIRSDEDLENFRRLYGIEEDIEKVY